MTLNETDEVVELANRFGISEQEVFEMCLEAHEENPNPQKAAWESDHYKKTGWVPYYVRDFYRNLDSLSDGTTVKFMKMLKRFSNNGDD